MGLVATIAGGVIALAIAMGVGRFIYTPLLPVMTDGFDLSTSAAGMIASANFVGYLVGALLASSAWFSGNKRSWVIVGLVASGMTTLAMGLVQDFWLFVALRFLGGIASALVLVFVSAIVIEGVSRAGHPGYATIHFAGVGLGIAGSSMLVALLAHLGAVWSEQWLAAGLLSLVGAAAVATLIKEAGSAGLARGGGAIDRRMIPLIVAYGLFGFGYVITATFIVAIVRASPALAVMEPWIWLITGLAGAPSVALWSWIASKTGLIQAFVLACLVEAVGVGFSVLWVSLAGIILAAVFLGGTFMGITALGLMAARRSVAGDSSRIIAVMTASFGLGQIIGPGFAGYAADVTQSYLGPSLAAVAALIAAASLCWVRRHDLARNKVA